MHDVSYVITVYNKAEYLPPVIKSLFAQRGKFNKEFIFINDGSTDNSLKILERMTEGRDDCTIVSGENIGPSKATNKGLMRASGNYIKLVDGDDILSPEMTQRLLASVEESGCPVAVGSKGHYRHGNSEALEYIKPDDQDAAVLKRPLKKLLKNAFFTPTHLLFNRTLLEGMQGCDERVFIQDYTIALMLARQASFVVEPAAIFFAPLEVGNRMSGNVAQILHDLNAAMYYLFSENTDLDSQLLRYGARRATGRAWRWARRENVPTRAKINAFRDYISSRLPVSDRRHLQLIRNSCHIFNSPLPVKDPLL